MGPGGIATIIAASSLAVIAVAVAYTVVRASRLIDEVTKTVAIINSPIRSISKAGKSLEEMVKKSSKAGESFLDENPMAMKAAGALFTAAKLKKKGKKKSKAKE